MNYLYDGPLSPDTMDHIRSMMRSYPNPIELKSVPVDVLNTLPDNHPSRAEDCMGGSYTKYTRRYGIVHKNFYDKESSVFVFLINVAEKQTVLYACRDLDIVVSEEPFKSII